MDTTRTSRRAFLAVVAAFPVLAVAQTAPRRMRVACLTSGGERMATSLVGRIRSGLEKDGLAAVEVRAFHATAEDFNELGRNAKEAAAWAPDAIFAPGPMHAVAARDATRTIPVVFFAVPDPATLGLVQSIARPGGNLTGSASDAAPLVSKRLELVREVLPRARKVVGFYRERPGSPTALLERIRRELAQESARLQLEFEPVAVDERGFTAALAQVERQRPDAIVPFGPYAWEPGGREVDSNVLFRELERRTRILVVGESLHGVRQGMLIAMYDGGSQLSAGVAMLARVLKGASPSDIPVQLPREYAVAVNRGAARAMGVELPAALLIRARDVID